MITSAHSDSGSSIGTSFSGDIELIEAQPIARRNNTSDYKDIAINGWMFSNKEYKK